MIRGDARSDEPADENENFNRAADRLADDLRRVGMGSRPRVEDRTEFAPVAQRLVNLDEASEKIKSELTATVGRVEASVLKQIADVRKRLDEFEELVKKSTAASTDALVRQLAIATETLGSVAKIDEQIEEFKKMVSGAIPPSQG